MPINNKVSKDLLDLEPTAILEFYKIYYDTINEPDSFFPFHPCSNGLEGKIILNNIAHVPLAVEIEDFETNIFNRINRPKIRISNEQLIISQILRRKNDFKFAKIERIKIFTKYIDDVNFEGGINPYGIADPNSEISRDSYVVSQKTQENKSVVEFELTAPFDLENFSIPGRLVMGRYCYWQYRGLGCHYFGPPVCQENDSSFTYIPQGSFNFQSSNNEWRYGIIYDVGAIVYVSTPKDPFKTWYVCKEKHLSSENNTPGLDNVPWEKDGCSKSISSCKKRFGSYTINYQGISGNSVVTSSINNPVPGALSPANTIARTKFYLPFGGFPATDNYQYGPSYLKK
jgi:lambda family phage minor tail protein L